MSIDNVELCKHQLKDQAKSTWNNVVMRNCKLKARRDGYCDTHHPENVAEALERAAQAEICEEVRAVQRREEGIVGAYIRLRRAEEFSAILSELRSADDLRAELRRAGRTL